VQTQVSKDYTFAQGCAPRLRQDPDVIMVGEIRDAEVASTAVHASLTGHLVFSTLHTNDAAGTFPRLIDMGVNADILGAARHVAMAQRLVRRLCPHCREPAPIRAGEKRRWSRFSQIFRMRTSCPRIATRCGSPRAARKCGGIGYKGRIAVVEVILMDQEIEEVRAPHLKRARHLESCAHQRIRRMAQDGAVKVLQGVTSLDELGRVVDLHDEVMLETMESMHDDLYGDGEPRIRLAKRSAKIKP
jgi:type II secretory ATPase GspE/PulE/Tfp pilus assembly ATPase PilB-like protein